MALGTSNAVFYVGVVVINSVMSADVVIGHFVAVMLHGVEDSAARLKFPSRGMAVPD